jgi:hypothetical protein
MMARCGSFAFDRFGSFYGMASFILVNNTIF